MVQPGEDKKADGDGLNKAEANTEEWLEVRFPMVCRGASGRSMHGERVSGAKLIKELTTNLKQVETEVRDSFKELQEGAEEA